MSYERREGFFGGDISKYADENQKSKNVLKKFNIFSLLSLIFSFYSFLLISICVFIIVGEYDERIAGVFGILGLLLNLIAFVFQFIARTKKSFVLWKIFSWISFGLCILNFLLFIIAAID